MKTPFILGGYCISQTKPLSLLPFNVFSNLGERSQAPAKATEKKKGGSDKADIYAIEPIGAIALMQELCVMLRETTVLIINIKRIDRIYAF